MNPKCRFFFIVILIIVFQSVKILIYPSIHLGFPPLNASFFGLSEAERGEYPIANDCGKMKYI
jgi:hypothetical protein